jgi:hypothetical protein
MKQYSMTIQGMQVGSLMMNTYTVVSDSTEGAKQISCNLFEAAYPYATAVCVQSMSKNMDIPE